MSSYLRRLGSRYIYLLSSKGSHIVISYALVNIFSYLTRLQFKVSKIKCNPNVSYIDLNVDGLFLAPGMLIIEASGDFISLYLTL